MMLVAPLVVHRPGVTQQPAHKWSPLPSRPYKHVFQSNEAPPCGHHGEKSGITNKMFSPPDEEQALGPVVLGDRRMAFLVCLSCAYSIDNIIILSIQMHSIVRIIPKRMEC